DSWRGHFNSHFAIAKWLFIFCLIFSIFLPTTKPPVMPTQTHKPSAFLTIPWGLMSIVLVLLLNLTLNGEWFQKNWSWIALVLIIPAAILENFKVGYSTMRIMFMKVVYSLISFLLVGMAFGSALSGWHIAKFQKVAEPVKTINLPWYVMLALGVLLMIQVAQLFSMLKAVKREFMQMDPDQ
ncbi:MAG: hypothetical protein KA428_13350, partial [Chitinophagaceae bacterium]|nr:hypothetical protein [Chitinophagaceae bacterium]